MLRKVSVLLLVLTISLVTVVLAGEGKKHKHGIDTNKTLELVKSWAARESFPDSAPFAYYHTFSLLALEGKISADAKKKIISFIKACQRENGGFVTQPVYAHEPNVIFTYYAVKTLSMLDSVNEIDAEKARAFVLSLVQKDGSIKASHFKSDRSNLDTTYYGVMALNLLKAQDKLDKKKTVAYINSYREKGKGFGKVIKKQSVPESTYMGIVALDSFGVLTEDIKTEVIKYLLGTRYSGLIKNKKYKTLPSIKDMSYVLAGLGKLSALSKADTAKMFEFVESLYIEENGGFGPRPGLGTTPPSTFHGVLSLAKLAKVKDPLKD